MLKILAAHSFPPTALRFNPSATLLVSASADNTIRAIVVPASFSGGALLILAKRIPADQLFTVSREMIAVLVAILIVILALALRR